MKKLLYLTLPLAIFIIIASAGSAFSASLLIDNCSLLIANDSFPSQMTCTVKPFYKFRKDGKPGRVVEVAFPEGRLFDKADIEILIKGKAVETAHVQQSAKGTDLVSIILPPGIGVKEDVVAELILRSGKNILHQGLTIPVLRQWTVYVYPHSHVDIGYSNTQANVEIIHKRNLMHAIRIANETKGNPEGSRYLWNPEVLWPVERYLKNATHEQAAYLLDAVKRGDIRLDASYVHVNTSACNDEELFRLFEQRRELQKLTGASANTFVQVDIPGISWGLIPVMNHEGIKYVYNLYNGGARVGSTSEMTDRPFWWVGPDGKSKVLYFQPNDGYLQYSFDKGFATGRPWLGQIDPAKIPETFKTSEPRKYFLGDNLFKKLEELEKSDYYPYDIFSLSWGLWDNTPIDEDLPAAVKSWNEEYAYPHLIISGTQEIMSAFEKKYGDRLPVYKGDLTEYWTDGLGTAAAETATNLATAERLIQSETLWSMLSRGKTPPAAYFSEAWRNCILGSEHTYVYERTGLGDVSWSKDKSPADAFFRESIFGVKKSFFREADVLSKAMLEWALLPLKDTSKQISALSSQFIVLNTLSWDRSGLVILSKEQSAAGDRVTDERGESLPSQRLSTGELVFLPAKVPALGSAAFRVMPGKPASPPASCSIDALTATNGLITVQVNPVTGNIISLKQNGSKYEFVNPDAEGGLNIFRQLPGASTIARTDTNIKISITEKGPLVVEWQIMSAAPGCSSVARKLRLVAGQPWLEFTDIIDKQKVTDKEGIHIGFTFSIAKPEIHVDIPWGIMRVEADQMPAANRNWLTLQRWLDISNDKTGVTWVSLDAPLFEVGAMTANILGEGKGWLRHLEPSATIYSWALNNHWFTNFPLSQEGKLTFRYRLMPHENAYDAAAANRFGMDQKQPLIVTSGKKAIDKPILQLISSPSVVVAILKTSDDGRSTIIRLRSVSLKDEAAQLSWPSGKPAKLQICDTKEEPGKDAGDTVTVPANGFITIRAEW